MRGGLRDALVVGREETRQAFRDRHTVLYAIALPLFLYPALFLGAAQVLLAAKASEERATFRVALAGEFPPSELTAALDGTERFTLAENRASPLDPEEVRAGLRTRFDVALSFTDRDKGRLFYDSSLDRSLAAKLRVEETLEAWREEVRRAAAQSVGLEPSALEPFRMTALDVAGEGWGGRFALALLLPFVLLLVASTGAFYPAVDATAGEKERRTAETTLLLPLPRRTVVLGKYLAVLAAGGCAAALNFASMVLASGHFLIQARKGPLESVTIPLHAAALAFALCLLFVATASAVLMAAASFARTFKEGQALATPILLLVVFPAAVSILPGTRLTMETAPIPVVGVALALRQTLVGRIEAGPLLLCAASLVVTSVASLALAVRLLGRSDLALAEETVPLHRRFAFLRRSGAGA